MAERDGGARGGGLGFIPWLLGFVISTMSIATLVHYGIVTGDLSAPIQALLDAYNDAIGIAFNPIEPYLRDAMHWLGSLVGWDVQLFPHWRHVFLLSMVFFLAAARVVAGYGGLRDLQSAAVFVTFGSMSSLVGALVGGSVSHGDSALNEAMIVAAPALAMFVTFTLIRNEADYRRLTAVLGSLATVLALTLFELLNQELGITSPGLAMLGFFVIAFASILLVSGVIDTLFLQPDAHVRKRLQQDISVQLGLVMLGGFVGAAALFAADAALKLAP